MSRNSCCRADSWTIYFALQEFPTRQILEIIGLSMQKDPHFPSKAIQVWLLSILYLLTYLFQKSRYPLKKFA
jgi:hypothetical protein